MKAESRPGKPNADDAKRIAKFKAGGTAAAIPADTAEERWDS